ncbi:MAG: hypothetical protein ISS18_12660 [Bacteroidales bacterium]|nr:hypothetical protein [Bacteroidales bacterium]
MAITIENETYLKVPESAIKVGRAVNTVYQNYKEWGWPPYKYGATLLFKESDIQAWLYKQVCAV